MEDERRRGPTLALDVGDAFLKGLPIPAPVRQQYGDKAEVVARSYGRFLDAFVPGDLDAGDNARWMRDVVARNALPAIAANLVDKEGKPAFPPHAVREVAGLRVLLVGATDPALWPAGLSLNATPAVPALREALARAQAHDLAILLAHTTVDTAAAWAAEAGGFSLVVTGHGGHLMFAPRRVVLNGEPAASVVLSGGKGGKYLARATVHVRAGERTLLGGEDYQRTRVGAENLRRKLQSGEDARLRAELQALEAQITADQARSRLDFEPVAMELSLPEDPVVAAEVAAYQRRNAERESQLLDQMTPQGEPPPGSPFAGSRACTSCHEQEFTSWLNTRHSRAMASLRKTAQDMDRECVGCHSTAFGTAGGFRDPARMGGFAEVQCEACHGPGRNHVAEQGGRDNIERGAGERLCRNCHTRELTPQFRFGPDREAIRHWKGR
ncbi:MAG: hypothetical protein HY904_24240 [Deltaproteobacteria bacterium]|nr:hypothetical protein [Deltaproteobacteria bacterium]